MTDEQAGPDDLGELLDSPELAELLGDEPELNADRGIAALSGVVGAMTAADGRGILGEDFLGGQDPAEVIREMRDGEPLPADGRYVLASSEEEALEVVRRVTEEGRNAAPVKFEADENDMATLTFGPMPFDDLMQMLAYLGSPEGSVSFLESLAGAMGESVAQNDKG